MSAGEYFPYFHKNFHDTAERFFLSFGSKVHENSYQLQGSPTYAKTTNAVPTTAVFGLCTCKWGIFALVGDPLQSH